MKSKKIDSFSFDCIRQRKTRDGSYVAAHFCIRPGEITRSRPTLTRNSEGREREKESRLRILVSATWHSISFLHCNVSLSLSWCKAAVSNVHGESLTAACNSGALVISVH